MTLAATGGVLEADKDGAPRDFEFYDLKGALDTAREALKLPGLDYRAAEVKHLRSGQSGAVSINGTRIGSIGRLAEAAAGTHKFRQPGFVAEIDLTALLEIKELPVLYARLPRFPSIVRDVSLLVERKVTLAGLVLSATVQKL